MALVLLATFFDIPHLRKQARKLPLAINKHHRRFRSSVIDLCFRVMVVSSPSEVGC